MRKPVIQPREEQKTATSALTETSQSGLSAIPLATASLSDVKVKPRPGKPQQPTEKQRDFLEIARRTGTKKVTGADQIEACLKDGASCGPWSNNQERPQCKVDFFYHTLYQKWLGPYSTDDAEPFQFLEIGHYSGQGYEAFKEFLPRAETHSIDMACIEAGPIEEGKWPYGNFPASNPKYQEYLDTNQLHCGDATDYDFLQETWTTKMKRPDAPPLKVVVDDAAHVSDHMAKSLLFWFPKIEPGGVLVVEGIQPSPQANPFRTHVVSQILKDLHYCGDPKWPDRQCFPTIQPLLQSVHCELHICLFERNAQPAVEYDRVEFAPPPNTLSGAECLLRSTPI